MLPTDYGAEQNCMSKDSRNGKDEAQAYQGILSLLFVAAIGIFSSS